MAQTNDSQPTHPVITFRVNLETIDRVGTALPNRTATTGNETTSEADQMKNTRTIYIPGLLAGENKHKLHHGDTFEVKGKKALYLKNLYVTGSADDLLVVVSES